MIIFLAWFVRLSLTTIHKIYHKYCASEAARREATAKAEENEVTFNENLPNFFKAIPGHLQKQWYVQELYDRAIMGARNLTSW